MTHDAENSNSAPLPDTTESSIVIKVDPDKTKGQKISIQGKLRVLCGQDGVPDVPLEVLKHVVLVVTREEKNYQTVVPFKDVVVFEDDINVVGDTCSAFFNIDVMDHIHFDYPGDYFILCSIGTHVSNIVHVPLND